MEIANATLTAVFEWLKPLGLGAVMVAALGWTVRQLWNDNRAMQALIVGDLQERLKQSEEKLVAERSNVRELERLRLQDLREANSQLRRSDQSTAELLRALDGLALRSRTKPPSR